MTVKRPLLVLTVAGTAAHHLFELGAGVGLVFQPQLGGVRRALAFWTASLLGAGTLAARGSRRWDGPLASFAGSCLGGSAVHYTLWPWRLRAGVPLLTEAEGLRPAQLPAYNAVVLGWGVVALLAVGAETPRGARRWAVPGVLGSLALRGTAVHHFEWLHEQAAGDPAWWNRAVREPRRALSGNDVRTTAREAAPMTTFNHTITIDRPLEEVWDYVVDPANDPVWQGTVVEVRSGAEGPIAVGTEIEEVVQFLGRRFDITFEVTEHEPMTRSAVKAKSGPVPMQGTYRFERVGGATRFSMEGETDAHGLFKLAEPVFARMARREWATSCDQLKDILEAGPRP